MTINQKINARMYNLVLAYNTCLMSARQVHPLVDKLMPRSLKWGGWRNTCYDYRKQQDYSIEYSLPH